MAGEVMNLKPYINYFFVLIVILNCAYVAYALLGL